jgi:moderate conductance mechanosensitive channel
VDFLARHTTSGDETFYEANRDTILIAVTIALVGLITWLLVWIARKVTVRITDGAQAGLNRAEAGSASHQSKQQLLRRTRTMSNLVTNAIVWVQVCIATAIVFGILGVDVSALVASAGLIAAVLTFSAQTLLKDVITGLAFIADDQLDVGDVVDVGFGQGVVEVVGLRVTQIRGFDGLLWCVRNGEIVRTANRSRGWVRFILEIDFSTDSDEAIARTSVLAALTDALNGAASPSEIRASPTCWGMSGFDGYGFRLKFLAEYSALAFDRLDPALREAARRAVRETDGIDAASPLLLATAANAGSRPISNSR